MILSAVVDLGGGREDGKRRVVRVKVSTFSLLMSANVFCQVFISACTILFKLFNGSAEYII